MKKYFVITLLIIAVLTILIWFFSVFVQPVLPNNINDGLLLFSVILFSVIGFLVKVKEITEFFHSLFENPKKGKSSVKQESNIVLAIRERARFLKDINEKSDPDLTEEKLIDLLDFIEKLQHGEYFIKKIKEITYRPRSLISSLDEDPQKRRRRDEEYNQQYLKQMIEIKNNVLSYVEELIKFQ